MFSAWIAAITLGFVTPMLEWLFYREIEKNPNSLMAILPFLGTVISLIGSMLAIGLSGMGGDILLRAPIAFAPILGIAGIRTILIPTFKKIRRKIYISNSSFRRHAKRHLDAIRKAASGEMQGVLDEVNRVINEDLEELLNKRAQLEASLALARATVNSLKKGDERAQASQDILQEMESERLASKAKIRAILRYLKHLRMDIFKERHLQDEDKQDYKPLIEKIRSRIALEMTRRRALSEKAALSEPTSLIESSKIGESVGKMRQDKAELKIKEL